MSEGNSTAFDERTIAAFANHLEAFAQTLSESDRALLARLLTKVLDPWDRMRLRDPSEILSPEEEAILRSLDPKDAP